MERALLISLAASLSLTLVLETGFFLLTGKRNKKDLLLVALANVMTNPAVVLLYWLAVDYSGFNWIITIAVLEVLAVLTEGYIYKKHGQDFKRPYGFSLFANMFSYGTGMLLQMIFQELLLSVAPS